MAGARNTPPHAGAILSPLLSPLDHFALCRAKLAAGQATGAAALLLATAPTRLRSRSLHPPTVHSAPPLPPGATTAGVLLGATTAGAPELGLSIG